MSSKTLALVNTEALEERSLGYASGKSNKVTNIIPDVCAEGEGGVLHQLFLLNSSSWIKLRLNTENQSQWLPGSVE